MINMACFFCNFTLIKAPMKKIVYTVFFLIPFILWSSCKKFVPLSTIPSIEYKSFQVVDTTDPLGNKAKGGRLKFTFEDGDGDLGVSQGSGSPADTNNLVITLYKKEGGVMVPAGANDPLLPASYRIPYINLSGQNKALKGTITVTFLYLFFTNADTVKYDFYIIDRANNHSNVASTNEIVISKNGFY